MEGKEEGKGAGATGQSERKDQVSSSPRVVIVIFHPDGRTIINQVEAEGKVPDELGKNVGKLVSALEFATPPRRFEVLLEKWGKTKGNAEVAPKKEGSHE